MSEIQDNGGEIVRNNYESITPYSTCGSNLPTYPFQVPDTHGVIQFHSGIEDHVGEQHETAIALTPRQIHENYLNSLKKFNVQVVKTKREQKREQKRKVDECRAQEFQKFVQQSIQIHEPVRLKQKIRKKLKSATISSTQEQDQKTKTQENGNQASPASVDNQNFGKYTMMNGFIPTAKAPFGSVIIVNRPPPIFRATIPGDIKRSSPVMPFGHLTYFTIPAVSAVEPSNSQSQNNDPGNNIGSRIESNATDLYPTPTTESPQCTYGDYMRGNNGSSQNPSYTLTAAADLPQLENPQMNYFIQNSENAQGIEYTIADNQPINMSIKPPTSPSLFQWPTSATESTNQYENPEDPTPLALNLMTRAPTGQLNGSNGDIPILRRALLAPQPEPQGTSQLSPVQNYPELQRYFQSPPTHALTPENNEWFTQNQFLPLTLNPNQNSQSGIDAQEFNEPETRRSAIIHLPTPSGRGLGAQGLGSRTMELNSNSEQMQDSPFEVCSVPYCWKCPLRVPRLFQCNICEAKLFSEKQMNAHIDSHLQRGEMLLG